MRIGIDCRLASVEGGLQRYTRELTTALLAADPSLPCTLFVRSPEEEWLKGLSGSPSLMVAPYRHYGVREQFLFPHLLKHSGIRVLFSPHFNVPLLCPVPFVATIHDLTLHRFPNAASLQKRLAYRLLMRHAVFKSVALVTVSNATREDIVRTYGGSLAPKISVIPNGVHERFSPQPRGIQEHVRSKYGLSKPYFLYVGNAKEHKNLPLLLSAFAEIHSRDTELVLVTGGSEVSALSIPSAVRVLHAIPDTDLPALYSGALAFVTASLLEGFCLPAAEAQACGCPVIAPRSSAFPEVVSAEGSLLIEPTIEALKKALLHPPHSSTVPPRRFSWEENARNILALLRSLP